MRVIRDPTEVKSDLYGTIWFDRHVRDRIHIKFEINRNPEDSGEITVFGPNAHTGDPTEVDNAIWKIGPDKTPLTAIDLKRATQIREHLLKIFHATISGRTDLIKVVQHPVWFKLNGELTENSPLHKIADHSVERAYPRKKQTYH